MTRRGLGRPGFAVLKVGLALALLAGLAAAPAAAQGAAQEARDPAPETPYPWNSAAAMCDRTAGDPADVNAQLSDLVRAAADLEVAAAACRDALAAAPDDLRLRFQSGRILLAAGERAGLHAIESAAKAGYPPAELFWGLALKHGRFDLPEDTRAALLWLRRAANNENAWAQVILGEALQTGDGTAPDLERAERRLRQAFRTNLLVGAVPLASFLLEREQRLSRTDREAAEAAAVEAKLVLREASAQGLTSAKVMLAMTLRSGGATFATDTKRAFELMQEAATAGSELAIYWLALWLYTGDGIRQDRESAAAWVCKLQDPEAMWRVLGALTKLSCDNI